MPSNSPFQYVKVSRVVGFAILLTAMAYPSSAVLSGGSCGEAKVLRQGGRNLRAGPSLASPATLTLPYGAVVFILDCRSRVSQWNGSLFEWVEVLTEDGSTGWMALNPHNLLVTVDEFNAPLRSAGTRSVMKISVAEGRLEVGEQASWSVAVPKQGSVFLSLRARVDWPELAGLAYIMDIQVNGQAVVGELLVNKRGSFTYADDRMFDYYGFVPEYSTTQTPLWGLLYSPDFASNVMPPFSTRYRVMEGQAYDYLFDVTSLVRAGRVSVTLANQGQGYSEFLDARVPLVYQQLELLVVR
ncbi:MAG TPA: SH3 domain-containing protein [Anaerolineales bacterium]|nr:SH3 domain-containing protein [Anaerolineales bacterium]